ncbi:MAG: TIGR02996 domain-containing protein, partial [Deltaproteobacteria bacterium]|nr:TIGR02996 domain-containing protein [Deltaproteobacteria bacterium]
ADRVPAHVRAVGDALLEAVYASPGDDGPRMVLADALLERNDPRGELIALQLRRDLGTAERRREKVLLASHRRTWLGDLAPIIRRCEFERGFLAVAEVIADDRDLVRRLVGHPAWSTVHTLSGSAAIAVDPALRSLRTLAFDANRAVELEEQPAAWQELLTGAPRAIESLRYTARGGVRETAALQACTALPRLRTLAVTLARDVTADALGAVLAGPVLARLEELELAYTAGDRPFAGLPGLVERARVPALRLRITTGTWRLAMRLASRGTPHYRSAELSLDGVVPYNVDTVGALPSTVDHLTVARRGLSAAQRAAITSAAERRGMRLEIIEGS